jgi:hypothetical protein
MSMLFVTHVVIGRIRILIKKKQLKRGIIPRQFFRQDTSLTQWITKKMKAKERPILFNTEMVKAILAGKKTQTRRPVKPQPISPEKCYKLTGSGYSIFTDSHSPGKWRIAGPVGVVCEQSNLTNSYQWISPFGKPDDVLWVKETWQAYDPSPIYGKDNTAFDRIPMRVFSNNPTEGESIIEYKADQDMTKCFSAWRPSIHMPYWAARIFLRVKRVWVERVQDISASDCINEGCIDEHYYTPGADESTIFGFHKLWDSIYAKKGFGWDENPWVWACEFERIQNV